MNALSEYILKADQIKKSFGGVHALQGVSIAIKKGEVHCLAGENGCGKSTLIKVISGFYQPDGGSLEIEGKVCDRVTPTQAIEAGIQVIYQDFSIFPNMTVLENLALNQELAQKQKFVSWKRMRKTAETALAKIGVTIDLDALVETLPVADKQLIAICRALLGNAKLIIMDEPTTALTKKEVASLFVIIRKLQAQGIAVLFVSHKLDEVFEISERFTIFRSGKNVFSGDTKELDDKSFTYYMTGREFDDSARPIPLQSSETCLEVEGLSLQDGFDNISFSLKKGEILGITGLLGSGRTELAQTLFGYRKPDKGTIKIDGKPVSISSVQKAIELGIGYVPEDRLTEGLFLERSIENNILVTELDHLSALFGLLKSGEMDKETKRWVEELSIATRNPELPVQTLSGGNQQKVVLARWLAINLKVLILNGPTVGVDIGAKHDIHALIRKLAESGLSVIVISDDLPEILQTCHRIVIMQAGRLHGEMDAMSISSEELSQLATRI